MMAMAPARLEGATMSAATTDPMPKNAPWHRAATMRPPIMTSYDGARADSRLPTMNSTIRDSRARFRSKRVRAAVSRIAPRATESAYPEMR
ncbi:hypothetical protein AIIKEEIJ_00440 [Rhodococcus sp. YH1]|nr:hypothetical protein [Rhodococcus sp. YH1]